MSASSFLINIVAKRIKPPLVLQDSYTEFVSGVVSEILSSCKRSCIKAAMGDEGEGEEEEEEDGEGGSSTWSWSSTLSSLKVCPEALALALLPKGKPSVGP